jgi:hypothetical protein
VERCGRYARAERSVGGGDTIGGLLVAKPKSQPAPAKSDVGPWLVVGVGAAALVGLVYFLTRDSSASANAAQPAPPPPPTPDVVAPPPTRADYQITASNTTATMRAGQILGVMPPHAAGPGYSWSVLVEGGLTFGNYTPPDAGLKDLGWQSDGTDQVTPTAPGIGNIIMLLQPTGGGAVAEQYTIAVTATA